jgi:RNA polymerase sigma factor (sigma-70 family)
VIEQALNGNQRAFTAIYKRLDPIIAKTIRNKIYKFDSALIEDVKQDIFTKIFLKLKSFTPGRNFTTWAISIAIYHCIDRKQKPIITYENYLEQFQHNCKENSPEDNYISHEGRKDIANFVKENLCQKHSIMIYQKYFLNLKQREIAFRLNRPIGTVSGQQFHSVQVLRNKVKERNLTWFNFL